jgi:hypothetical protein
MNGRRVRLGRDTADRLRLLGRDVPALVSRLPDTRQAVLILVPLERERRLRPCRIVSAIRRGRHERGGMVVALTTDQQD